MPTNKLQTLQMSHPRQAEALLRKLQLRGFRIDLAMKNREVAKQLKTAALTPAQRGPFKAAEDLAQLHAADPAVFKNRVAALMLAGMDGFAQTVMAALREPPKKKTEITRIACAPEAKQITLSLSLGRRELELRGVKLYTDQYNVGTDVRHFTIGIVASFAHGTIFRPPHHYPVVHWSINTNAGLERRAERIEHRMQKGLEANGVTKSSVLMLILDFPASYTPYGKNRVRARKHCLMTLQEKTRVEIAEIITDLLTVTRGNPERYISAFSPEGRKAGLQNRQLA
ncbi:MAG: hypothetical protein HQ596_05465 [Candidatus Saganbacteria bacterium]|nr:hypothetical protein [Candidatus Saganbacteria bacterium]